MQRVGFLKLLCAQTARTETSNLTTVGKQFVQKLVGNTNAAAMELVVDPVLQTASSLRFDDVPSNLTPDGHHRNPHMDKTRPAGGHAFYVDGHAAWNRFIRMQRRYDPHDRVYWWW